MSKKVKPKPLKHRELLKRLKFFGIVEAPSRGKGSERMLIEKSGLIDGKYQGEQIPIKHHGQGTEHSIRVVDKVLSRFNIDPKEFW